MCVAAFTHFVGYQVTSSVACINNNNGLLQSAGLIPKTHTPWWGGWFLVVEEWYSRPKGEIKCARPNRRKDMPTSTMYTSLLKHRV